MSDLARHSKDRFSCNEAHFLQLKRVCFPTETTVTGARGDSVFRVLTRSETNWAILCIQTQKMAGGLKFWI